MIQIVNIVTPQQGSIELEAELINADMVQAPLWVFLHEGLGSLAMWRDWPAEFCARFGVRGLVYSRYGYGRSTPRPDHELWQLDYLHEQARDHLPALLKALELGAERVWLFGHSDGGTIALLGAALCPKIVQGVVAVAPHVFVEEESLAAIRATEQRYINGDLRARLQRYHNNPDSAFGGWSTAWLSPVFRHWDIRAELDSIRCPLLVLQGRQDEYASLQQIYDICANVAGAECQVLEDCGHSPHLQQSDALQAYIQDFLARH